MLTRIKNWYQKEDYKDGYDWAAGLILREEQSIDCILQIVTSASAFDRGARDAISRAVCLNIARFNGDI